MSAYENTPGIERKIHHIHNPIIPKKGVRKPRKKRVYANLMLTQQMVEAKEAEKRRINEVRNETTFNFHFILDLIFVKIIS
jgi:hypothetical protein